MPINIPDSFGSIGTAIVDGGETQQTTEIVAGPNIVLEQYQVPILTQRGFSPFKPAVAFSLRKLRTLNKCIQVQAGTNPALDIGFARNERGVMAIDEQQLLDYANQYPTNEIRVNKIYDQSGNGNDLVSDVGSRFKAVTRCTKWRFTKTTFLKTVLAIHFWNALEVTTFTILRTAG